MADLTVYGWERRQTDGSYVLIPETLCASEGGARHRAVGVAGSGWLWGADKDTQFRQQWNGGDIRPATFMLTRTFPDGVQGIDSQAFPGQPPIAAQEKDAGEPQQ